MSKEIDIEYYHQLALQKQKEQRILKEANRLFGEPTIES